MPTKKPNFVMVLRLRKLVGHLNRLNNIHKEFSVAYFASSTGTNLSTAGAQCSILLSLGLLERRKPGRGNHYLYKFKDSITNPVEAYVKLFDNKETP